MSFNNSLWDFTKKHRGWPAKGLAGIQSFDAISEKLLLSRRFILAKHWRTILGDELTITLLERSFQGYHLFPQDNHIQILHAEKIPTQTGEYLLQNSFTIKSGALLLAFAKESPLFKKLTQKNPDAFFKIESPKFWQADKLLDFLCQELQTPLPFIIKSYLIDALPMTTMDYVTALTRIKLHFPDPKSAEITQVKNIVTPCKLDQFALANLYARRKVIPFLKIVEKSNADFEALISLFSFMQRHLLRLLDPSYIKHKTHPSKYDREVATHAKLWQPEEICRQMKLFGNLEILAKKRSVFLTTRLRTLQTSVLK